MLVPTQNTSLLFMLNYIRRIHFTTGALFYNQFKRVTPFSLGPISEQVYPALLTVHSMYQDNAQC